MSYARLEDRQREVSHLDHAIAMLSWDEAVMMPAGSGAARADALATLASVRHRLVTAPDTAELIAGARAEVQDEWQRANLREIELATERAAALPERLVTELSRAATLCEQIWRKARPRNDWAAMIEPLSVVMELIREKAHRLAELRQLAPYDALLETYQSGVRRADIDGVFAELRRALPPLIEQRLAAQSDTGQEIFAGPFPRAAQERLARELMTRVGFDFDRGRLDASHHPFCGGVPGDVRVTTRYDESDFLSALMATLHETGHAMYEQGLPAAWRGQPVARAAGMAVHESQSLLMEMQICRGRPFLEFAAPIIAGAFGRGQDECSVEKLASACHRVARSYIRVDADELTYPLHVILRYEMEQALLAGSLAIREIPDAWDSAMDDLLGLRTGDDFENGCMQDVHWFAGLVGYFPCYTLGALMAAQLMAAIKAAMPDLDSDIRNGDFAPVRDWLQRRVHSLGRLHEGLDLLTAATGSALSSGAFLQHLESRYGQPRP